MKRLTGPLTYGSFEPQRYPEIIWKKKSVAI